MTKELGLMLVVACGLGVSALAAVQVSGRVRLAGRVHARLKRVTKG